MNDLKDGSWAVHTSFNHRVKICTAAFKQHGGAHMYKVSNQAIDGLLLDFFAFAASRMGR